MAFWAESYRVDERRDKINHKIPRDITQLTKFNTSTVGLPCNMQMLHGNVLMMSHIEKFGPLRRSSSCLFGKAQDWHKVC